MNKVMNHPEVSDSEIVADLFRLAQVKSTLYQSLSKRQSSTCPVKPKSASRAA